MSKEIPFGIPGVLKPGDATPVYGEPVSYNDRTGRFEVVPSTFDFETQKTFLSDTFGDGAPVNNPITLQRNK